MTPQQLLEAAATLTSVGDVSLRDDPLTYAWRTLHDDETDGPPDTALIDRAATHVSAVLGVDHQPDLWWTALARRDLFQVAALLAIAAKNAAPKGIAS